MEQRGECVITGEQALADPELKPLEHHLRDDKQVFENLALVVFHLKESAKNHSLYSPYYRTLNAGQCLRAASERPPLTPRKSWPQTTCRSDRLVTCTGRKTRPRSSLAPRLLVRLPSAHSSFTD